MNRRDVETVELTEINSWDDVPVFASEAEEAEFWATHGLGEALLEKGLTEDDLGLPPPRPRTKPVAVRFDPDTLGRLKAVARKKHKGYQTLLKEFVMERLYEEEKREGLIA
jgi:hypothetical protein